MSSFTVDQINVLIEVQLSKLRADMARAEVIVDTSAKRMGVSTGAGGVGGAGGLFGLGGLGRFARVLGVFQLVTSGLEGLKTTVEGTGSTWKRVMDGMYAGADRLTFGIHKMLTDSIAGLVEWIAGWQGAVRQAEAETMRMGKAMPFARQRDIAEAELGVETAGDPVSRIRARLRLSEARLSGLGQQMLSSGARRGDVDRILDAQRISDRLKAVRDEWHSATPSQAAEYLRSIDNNTKPKGT